MTATNKKSGGGAPPPPPPSLLGGGGSTAVYSLSGAPEGKIYNGGTFYDADSLDVFLGNLARHPGDLAAAYNWLTNQSPSGNVGQEIDVIRKAYAAAGGAKTSLFTLYPTQGGYDLATGTRRSPSNSASGPSSNPTIVFGSSGPGAQDMTASAELSAYSQVLGNLGAWGLESLSDQAWQMISDPGYHLNAGLVMQQIRQTPEYKAAFPGMDEIKNKGLDMTENQYLNHKMDIQDQFANSGIPTKMLTPEEMGKLISNGVYQGNLAARLQKGYEMVKNADPYIKKTLQDWYGVKPGHLLAYMVSPKHGQQQIVKEVQAAMINTEAHNAKFNGLDQKTAEQLSKQMTSGGYGMDTYKTGFAKAAGEQPLEQAQIGQRGQATVSQQQILAGTFAGLKEPGVGSQAEAQRAIELASQARTAGLQGGGGYAQNASGGLGIGSASSEGTGK